MSNISLPFLTGTSNDSISPNDIGLPHPFGLNVLMLSNSSVAVLDAPSPAYVQQIQARLSQPVSETWTTSATVNATVARYNSTLNQERNNDSFWNSMPHEDGSLRYQDCMDGSWVALDTWYNKQPTDRTECLLALVSFLLLCSYWFILGC